MLGSIVSEKYTVSSPSSMSRSNSRTSGLTLSLVTEATITAMLGGAGTRLLLLMSRTVRLVTETKATVGDVKKSVWFLSLLRSEVSRVIVTAVEFSELVFPPVSCMEIVGRDISFWRTISVGSNVVASTVSEK